MTDSSANDTSPRWLLWLLSRAWLLRLLLRAFQCRWFQKMAIRPTVLTGLLWITCAIVLDKVPARIATGNPRAAQTLVKLNEALNRRVNPVWTDQDHALSQALTWGSAGLGVVILLTIVAARVFNTATYIATACFGVTVPMFIALGFAYQTQTRSLNAPPMVRDVIVLYARVFFVNAIFFFGFAALLWGYNYVISTFFIVGCILSARYSKKFAARNAAPQPNKAELDQ